MNTVQGTIKKMYGKNAITLDVNGVNKMFSQYGGIDVDVGIGDKVEFNYTEKEKDGKIYNNIMPNTVKIVSKSPRDVSSQYQGGSSPMSTNRPDVDWDEITRGKIRSLLLQAHVQKNGLVPLTEKEAGILESFVKTAMGDK